MFTIPLIAGVVAGCVAAHKNSKSGFVRSARPFIEGITGICHDTATLASIHPIVKGDNSWLSVEKEERDLHQKIETVGKSAVLSEFSKLSYKTKPVFAPLIQGHWQDMLRAVHEQFGSTYAISNIRRFDTHDAPISLNLEALGIDLDVKTEPKIGTKTTVTGIPSACKDTFTVVGYSNGNKIQADRYYILEKNKSPNEIRETAAFQAKIWAGVTIALFAISGITGVAEFVNWKGRSDTRF